MTLSAQHRPHHGPLIVCEDCEVSVAEVWATRSTSRWSWCTRTGRIGHDDTRAAATRAAMEAAKAEKRCDCYPAPVRSFVGRKGGTVACHTRPSRTPNRIGGGR